MIKYKLTMDVLLPDCTREKVEGLPIELEEDAYKESLISAQQEGLYIQVSKNKTKYIPANLFNNAMMDIEIL